MTILSPLFVFGYMYKQETQMTVTSATALVSVGSVVMDSGGSLKK